MTNQTKNQTGSRSAADLAAQISAEIETAHGLALALETLTGMHETGPAAAYNAEIRRPQTAAVLQTLCDQLERMQDAADRLEEITMQLLRAQQPPKGGAAA